MFNKGLTSLQNMLSIRVPLFVESRVGNVICGLRLCDIRRSMNSLYNMFACRAYFENINVKVSR